MRNGVFDGGARSRAPAGLAHEVEAVAASITEPARFQILFDRHFDAIHRYAVRNVGVDLAEDVVSETFLRAFRMRATFDAGAGAPGAWLYGIAANVIREGRRTADRRTRAYARAECSARRYEPAGDATGDGAVDAVRLRAALQRLEADLREAVLLVGAGLSYQEVAAALRIPLGTVGSRVSRARRQLASVLGERPARPRDLQRPPRALLPARRQPAPAGPAGGP